MNKILEINKDNFDVEINNFDGITLVLFTAEWDNQGRLQKTILEKEVESENIKICVINYEDNEEIFVRCRIKSIPLILFCKESVIVNMSKGVKSKFEIMKKIEESKKW